MTDPKKRATRSQKFLRNGRRRERLGSMRGRMDAFVLRHHPRAAAQERA